MLSGLVCPECKSSVIGSNNGYNCQNCLRYYPADKGYVDFLGDQQFYAGEVSQMEMNDLIRDIDSFGYSEAETNFYKKFPHLKYYLSDVRRADWVINALKPPGNNHRCLDIGSGLGNLSETLSGIYKEVYSLEAVKERIEFQKRRFENSNRSNITLFRSNALKLPFPNNYFDLVVCNGVLEWVSTLNEDLSPRQVQLDFLLEINRILSPSGCLYVGIENRFGLWFILGAKDHSGLRFTSLLPRGLADILVKRYGYAGGIYGDSNRKERETRGYCQYTYTIFGYRSLLGQAGFSIKPYWAYPSYNMPLFSGRLNDKLALKGFARHLASNSIKFKKILHIIERQHESILGIMTSLLAPSFLLYCYKEKTHVSLDEKIMNASMLQNYTVMSGGHNILYVLYDKQAIPRKVARLKRSSLNKDFSISIKSNNALRSNSHQNNDSITIEDWLSGRRLNPLNVHECNRAIDWLISFQNTSVKGKITMQEINEELKILERELRQLPNFNQAQIQLWLEQYRSYVERFELNRVSEHGDFWFSNILYDRDHDSINVLDWEYFKDAGNPFYDFVFFMINAMLEPGNSDREFLRNLLGTGNFSPILNSVRSKLVSHFGSEPNLQKLIPYTILRFIVTKSKEKPAGRIITDCREVTEKYKSLLSIYSDSVSEGTYDL